MSSGRASDGSGSGMPPIKAIGSLAKKQSDVTRQGTQKLKFVPTLPARRKKEEVKHESTTHVTTPASSSGLRGGPHSDARGRGRGKGIARSEVEMTASGPFAMGPTTAGSNITRRNVAHSSLAPFSTPSAASLMDSSHSSMPTPSVKKESSQKNETKNEEAEVYSDPEQGVEIVDMGSVRQMDFMAPESLREEGKRKKVKKQEPSTSIEATSSEIDHEKPLEFDDISDEEKLENVFEDFFGTSVLGKEMEEERLYSFQFPAPFPDFVKPVDDILPEKVASNTIPPGGVQEMADASQITVDGVIGRLEFYRSGAVKMRLFNGIVLDVTAATNPSFFQQAVYLDKNESRLLALGPVSKRFSASPDIETLLSAMELANKGNELPLQSDDLIQMDVV